MPKLHYTLTYGTNKCFTINKTGGDIQGSVNTQPDGEVRHAGARENACLSWGIPGTALSCVCSFALLSFPAFSTDSGQACFTWPLSLCLSLAFDFSSLPITAPLDVFQQRLFA